MVTHQFKTLSKYKALHWSTGYSAPQIQFSSAKTSILGCDCQLIAIIWVKLLKAWVARSKEGLVVLYSGYVVHSVTAAVETR